MLPTVLESDLPSVGYGKNAAWARLIQKVYEVDPLACPRCGAPNESYETSRTNQRLLPEHESPHHRTYKTKGCLSSARMRWLQVKIEVLDCVRNA